MLRDGLLEKRIEPYGGVSRDTIAEHVAITLRTLGAHTRAQLVVLALTHGFIELSRTPGSHRPGPRVTARTHSQNPRSTSRYGASGRQRQWSVAMVNLLTTVRVVAPVVI